uniref:LacI family DNA-binding transcriptional regulator n=1 Tax=Gordonia sp. B7-2 TaxID=3420932 RepID=UPI003D937935
MTNVGVVLSARSPFEWDLVDDLYEAADGAGYRLVLGLYGPRRSRHRVTAELAESCSAVIVVGPDRADRLDAVSGPLVIIGERIPDLDAVTVGTDEWLGGELATQHLIDLGHTTIAHLDGGENSGAAERLRGYHDAMAAAGLREHVRVFDGDYSERSGARVADEIIDGDDAPTAVFAANDRSAIGLVTELRRRGVRVPEEISVVGYDDSEPAALAHIALTSVRQDTAGLASAAMSAVGSLVGDSDEAADTGGCGYYGAVALDPVLTVRSSTAGARTRVRSV